MQGIDSYSARSKYHLTIKNLVCTHFYDLADVLGLTARLLAIKVSALIYRLTGMFYSFWSSTIIGLVMTGLACKAANRITAFCSKALKKVPSHAPIT